MQRSMTGFGKSEQKFSQGSVIVEIQSVNKRFFDISLNTPDELFFLQTEIRKAIQEKIFRGQIYLKIAFKFAEGKSAKLFEAKALQDLKTHLEKLAKSLGYNKKEISFPFLVNNYLAIKREKIDIDVSNIRKIVEMALNKALNDLIAMKEKEGAQLHLALKEMISFVEEKVELISKRAPLVLKANQKKAKDKAKEFIPENVEESEKILRSIGTLAKFFAEKGKCRQATRVHFTGDAKRNQYHIGQICRYADFGKRSADEK